MVQTYAVAATCTGAAAGVAATSATWTAGFASGVFFSAGGTSCQNLPFAADQSATIDLAFALPVFSACCWISVFSCCSAAGVMSRWMATISVLTCSPQYRNKFQMPCMFDTVHVQ